MAYLCTGDISTDQLLALIRSHFWEEEHFRSRWVRRLMAFSPAEARFEEFAYYFGLAVPGECFTRRRRWRSRYDNTFLSATEQGRIFSPDGELRWRKLGETLRTVYLGYQRISNVLTDCSDELEGLSPAKCKLLLWGKRTGHYSNWLEQQMPHRFDYPIDSSEFPRGRIALVVEQWVDTAGIPKFSRYHSIDEVQGEQ